MIHVWIRKHVVHRSKKQETNIDSLKGKQAVVVKAIDSNKPGYVSIYGVLWLARSADKSCIPQDSWVEIVDVQGAHVLVIKKSI